GREVGGARGGRGGRGGGWREGMMPPARSAPNTSLVRSPGFRLAESAFVPAWKGKATPSGTQSPQEAALDPPMNRQLASSAAWLPPLFFVRQTCWKPVNCVSGLTSSNDRNCRPVDAVIVARSLAARIGSSVRTQRDRSPLAKFVKNRLLWKLAKSTPGREG